MKVAYAVALIHRHSINVKCPTSFSSEHHNWVHPKHPKRTLSFPITGEPSATSTAHLCRDATPSGLIGTGFPPAPSSEIHPNTMHITHIDIIHRKPIRKRGNMHLQISALTKHGIQAPSLVKPLFNCHTVLRCCVGLLCFVT